MKNILCMMEQSCQKLIKPLCKSYLVFLLLLGLSVYFFDIELSMICLLLATVLYVTRIHYQGIRELTEHGAYARICLLPMKRTTLIFSELLFVLVSYLPLIFIVYLVWWLYGTMIQNDFADIVNSFFFYTLSSRTMSFLAPYHAVEIGRLCTSLCMISVMVVFGSFALIAWNFRSKALINSILGCILFIMMMIMDGWIGIVICWIYLFVDFYLMRKWSNAGRNQL